MLKNDQNVVLVTISSECWGSVLRTKDVSKAWGGCEHSEQLKEGREVFRLISVCVCARTSLLHMSLLFAM